MKTLTISVLMALTLLSCTSENSASEEANKQEQTAVQSIENTKWILTKLDGQEIKVTDDNPIYFMLNTEENLLSGSAGCNTMSGLYALEDGNIITFDKIAVTMMSCPDLTVNETEFLEVFNTANNYTINNGVLALNIGKRAPLAEFKIAK